MARKAVKIWVREWVARDLYLSPKSSTLNSTMSVAVSFVLFQEKIILPALRLPENFSLKSFSISSFSSSVGIPLLKFTMALETNWLSRALRWKSSMHLSISQALTLAA